MRKSVKIIIIFFLFLAIIFPFNAGAKSGCCSWHGGVAYCDTSVGRYVCNDGTYSPTCTCAYIPPTTRPPVIIIPITTTTTILLPVATVTTNAQNINKDEFIGELRGASILRDCPSVKCKAIGYYAEGTKLRIIGLDEDREWYKIIAPDLGLNPNQSGEINGWMHYSLFLQDFRSSFLIPSISTPTSKDQGENSILNVEYEIPFYYLLPVLIALAILIFFVLLLIKIINLINRSQ